MKNTYKIIKDPESLYRFIDWLPDLQIHETYYVILFARKKYCQDIKSIKSDKAQLKRFTSNKEILLQKLEQLECPIGAYRQKGDIVVPQEALAVYINPNPRNIEKAARNSLIKLAHLCTKPYQGYNPHQEVMSEIQKTKGKTRFVNFDFDFNSNKYFYHLMDWIRDRTGWDSGINTFIRTRGGCHVLVRPDKIREISEYSTIKSTWYNNIRKNQYCESFGDMMIPIPGCTQGNFVPQLILI